MIFFWILWGVDAVITLIALCVFFDGIIGSPVMPDNTGGWTLVIAGLGALLLGTHWLQTHQYGVLAKILLAVPAFPGLLYGFFIIMAIILDVRWN